MSARSSETTLEGAGVSTIDSRHPGDHLLEVCEGKSGPLQVLSRLRRRAPAGFCAEGVLAADPAARCEGSIRLGHRLGRRRSAPGRSQRTRCRRGWQRSSARSARRLRRQ